MFGRSGKRRSSGNKKFDADGNPIFSTFIDESGHPYYDRGDVGPFAMGAVITDDPAKCSRKIIAERPRKKTSDGSDELKSSRAGQSINAKLTQELNKEGYAMLVTSQPMLSEDHYPKEFGGVVYSGVLSRLLIKIAEEGPSGVYRIYVDDSEYIDTDLLKRIAESAFNGVDGKSLAIYKPVNKLDSEFSPPIQAADMVVGGYRRALKRKDDKYAERNHLIVANRKRRGWKCRTPRHRRQEHMDSPDPVRGAVYPRPPCVRSDGTSSRVLYASTEEYVKLCSERQKNDRRESMRRQ